MSLNTGRANDAVWAAVKISLLSMLFTSKIKIKKKKESSTSVKRHHFWKLILHMKRNLLYLSDVFTLITVCNAAY